MKILITGATGFLGQHLVRVLCDQGLADDIRVLARSVPQWLEKLGVEIVKGSITNQDDAARAVVGASRIYHLAGMVSRKPADSHRMHDVHVAGTRILCRAATNAGVQRIVLVSTSGTVAVSRGPNEMPDEDCPAPLDIIGRWPYYASKHFQEETAIRECDGKLELVRVNPSLLLGPGDDRLSSTKDVMNFLAREIPVIPGGGINFVDVRDVAQVLPAAMEKGRAGERYLMGAYNWTLKEFFGRLARLSKVDAPLLTASGRFSRLPYLASRVQAAVLKGIGRTAAIEPAGVEMGEYFWYFSSEKAATDLGFAAREASETLFDTVDYLRKNFFGVSKGAAFSDQR